MNDPENPFSYLVTHRVFCSSASGEVGDHAGHRSQEFLDEPRLFAGDNKASVLRGTHAIDNVQEYTQERSGEICLHITRDYSCTEYHLRIDSQFRRLEIPGPTWKIQPNLRPLLFTLDEDAEPAHHSSEQMAFLSGELRIGLFEIGKTCSTSNDYPGLEKDSELHWPYLALHHRRKALRDSLPDIEHKIRRQHLAVLLEYIESELEAHYSEADELFQQRLVTLTHFEKLFRPNDVVIHKKKGQVRAYLAKGATETGKSHRYNREARTIQLNCRSWEFDGAFFSESTTLTVTWPDHLKFMESMKITDLGIYPLRYDTADTEELLKKRGERFWKCRRGGYISYNPPQTTLDIHTSNSRYMIDMRVYLQMHPEKAKAHKSREELDEVLFNREDVPPEPFILLLPTQVKGFGFHDKNWKSLDVDYIEDINWNTGAFDNRLVLHHSEKELIKALVTVHVETSGSNDVIEGKGNGLIMLLHGGPGTGKTLTAESVAELTESHYAVHVEKYLESVFYIGVTWDCVVLLDEADVFLEERTQTDLQRNALVSVFLRAVEYYNGILILTTNRVGTFDEAFKSRVQLAIHYPSLDQDGRWEIWYNFITAFDEEKDNVKIGQLRGKLDQLARHKLNGRQIRNAIKTARQLAYYRKEKLDYAHFERVLEVTNRFEAYLTSTHGHTDAEWAKEEGIRGS